MNSVLEISINAIASVNALLLFSFLAFRRNNSLPNITIAVVMLIPALYFTNSILMLNGNGWSYSTWFFIVQFLAVLYSPSLTVYVFALLGKNIKNMWWVFSISLLIGTIPLVLYIRYSTWDVATQKQFFNSLINGPYPDMVTLYSIVFYSFQQLVFIYLLHVVYKIRKRAQGFHSNLDKTKLDYLYNFMRLLVMFNFFIILLYIVFDILFVEYLLLPFIVGCIYTFLVYFAFKNNTIFTKQDYQIHLATTQKLDEDITKSILDEDTEEDLDTQAIIFAIEEVLKQGLLQDQQLSINSLAEAINRPVKTVSSVINNSIGTNFYDYINSKRIEESKNLLKSKSEYTIEAIAYECGFNSRASFYRAFKKYTNSKPSEYLNAN